MTTVTIYDPSMCCSTGVCGVDVDQQLITFAADLDWLKSKGVTVRRINLSQEPAEFTINEEVNALMHASGGDELPAILIDGKMVSKARYPSRKELAAWNNLAFEDQDTAASASPCCSLNAKSSCC